jgi:hypothetical protein
MAGRPKKSLKKLMQNLPLGMVPGITSPSLDGYPAQGISPRWGARANRMLGYMTNNPKISQDFKPFVRDAERWLQGALGQLAGASGGVAGPIESQALATAAWQLAYARFWHWKLAEDPMNAKLAETASRIADAARQNALAAYDLAVRLFRHAPVNVQDPLEAFEAQLVDATPGKFSESQENNSGPNPTPEFPAQDPPTPSDVSLENDS